MTHSPIIQLANHGRSLTIRKPIIGRNRRTRRIEHLHTERLRHFDRADAILQQPMARHRGIVRCERKPDRATFAYVYL
jgi:hypothetical protein